jgi:alanyl-tRNA synthetase
MRLEDLAQGLPPTNRLYLKDSYLTKFSAKVLRAEKEGKNKTYLILDSTAFHPKSGGQPSDTGVLVGQRSQVKISKVMSFREVVVHWGVSEGAICGEVSGEIDWALRYLYMRRHTAVHLLDHCLTQISGKSVETTDSWLGAGCYITYQGTAPSKEIIQKAVELENKLVARGGSVIIDEIDREELLRRAPNAPNILRLPKLERYRVVTIQGCEPIPCAGTHLRDIKEISEFRLDRMEQRGQEFRVCYDVNPTP